MHFYPSLPRKTRAAAGYSALASEGFFRFLKIPDLWEQKVFSFSSLRRKKNSRVVLCTPAAGKSEVSKFLFFS